MDLQDGVSVFFLWYFLVFATYPFGVVHITFLYIVHEYRYNFK